MKAVDFPWLVRSFRPTELVVPTLSVLFVLNKLTPFCNTLCLEILFHPALGLPQQEWRSSGPCTLLREHQLL